MATIRVRVNPADPAEYVIYADPEDPPAPWLGQAEGGRRYTGWVHDAEVTDWPEFELTTRDAPAPDDLGGCGRLT